MLIRFFSLCFLKYLIVVFVLSGLNFGLLGVVDIVEFFLKFEDEIVKV